MRPWGATSEGLLRRTLAGGARWFGVGRAAEPAPAVPRAMADAVAPEPAAAAPPGPPPNRSLWADRLWGEGLALPGGATEVLRLASLLPLRPEMTLLLAGGGARAAGSIVSGARGCFVAACEPGAPPAERRGRSKVTAAPFDPAEPAFRRGYHHHALLLEPFRAGGGPDSLLTAAALGLRPGAQLVLLDLVARGGAAGPWETRWLAAEGRAPPPPEAAVPAALQRAGFEIHVVEDAGTRHRAAVLEAWRSLMAALRAEMARPPAGHAGTLVAEAEAWLLRLRLMQEGRLSLLRWHASVARPPR